MNDNFFVIRPQEPRYKFSPRYDLHFGTCEIDKDLMKELNDYLLSIEIDIIKRYTLDKNLSYNLDYNSINSRFMLYNLFEFGKNIDVINLLRSQIKNKLKSFLNFHNYDTSTLYVACWFIILRNSECLPEHTHDSSPNSFISGNLIVSCDDSTTEYVLPYQHGNYSIKNAPGSLTLFPSCLSHYTSKHRGPMPRISVAFDIFPSLDHCKSEYLYRFVEL